MRETNVESFEEEKQPGEGYRVTKVQVFNPKTGRYRKIEEEMSAGKQDLWIHRGREWGMKPRRFR